jgi:hypothetical protein
MPRIYKLQIVNNFAVKNNKPSRLGDKFDANERIRTMYLTATPPTHYSSVISLTHHNQEATFGSLISSIDGRSRSADHFWLAFFDQWP